jgi:hypothetical protein
MMTAQPFSKVFTDTDRIVITQAEHQQSWSSLHTCRSVLYPRRLDGTLDRAVTLAYDRVTVGEQNTVTIHLLTPRSGVVELWPPAPQAPLMR